MGLLMLTVHRRGQFQPDMRELGGRGLGRFLCHFGHLGRGLQVCGWKVIKPEALVTAVVSQGG